MVAGIGSNNYYQNMMQASQAGSFGISQGAYGQQQQFTPKAAEDQDIFSAAGINSRQGVSEISFGQNPFNVDSTKGSKAQEEGGLVSRLDAMDARFQKPQCQDEFRANKLDLFA